MLGEGRLFMVLPLAPLTALGVAVMGTNWTSNGTKTISVIVSTGKLWIRKSHNS